LKFLLLLHKNPGDRTRTHNSNFGNLHFTIKLPKKLYKKLTKDEAIYTSKSVKDTAFNPTSAANHKSSACIPCKYSDNKAQTASYTASEAHEPTYLSYSCKIHTYIFLPTTRNYNNIYHTFFLEEFD